MQLEARHDTRLPSIGRKSARNMRFSVRALLWLILFCAIALASGIYGTRLIKLSGNYRKKALSYAAIANLETQNVATAQAAVNHPDPVFRARYARVLRKVAENCAVRIEHFKSMERKYSRAAVHVWETVSPDPPEPPSEPIEMPNTDHDDMHL